MQLRKIPPFRKDLINVVIETPKGSVYKYDFDPKYAVFQLNKIMPLGMAFPFDFGFLPNTIGGDGDPLDVLVLMDAPAIQGSLICCRPLALLEAEQIERDGKKMRNDRIVAVCNYTLTFKSVTSLEEINKDLKADIEHFFKAYNEQAGKQFIPKSWKDSKAVLKLIKKQQT